MLYLPYPSFGYRFDIFKLQKNCNLVIREVNVSTILKVVKLIIFIFIIVVPATANNHIIYTFKALAEINYR